MPEKVRIGIIGCGGIGQCHMDGYMAQKDRVELVACCDLEESKAKHYAEKYGFPHIYTDFNEMLDKEKLDAVSVTTWNASHCAPTIAALNHGVNVICEKPMAMNHLQAEEMEAAAKKNNKVLQIGFVRRYGTDCESAKEFIDAGEMGNIYYAKVSYLRRSGCPGGWFADLDYAGGGPLIDLGVHVMDMSRYLAGCPQPVAAYGRTFRGLGNNRAAASNPAWVAPENKGVFKCDVEDFATGLITFDNGFTLSVEASFNLNIAGDCGTMELFGDKAGARLGGTMEVFTQKDGQFVNLTRECGGFDFGGSFRKEIAHYLDCVQYGVECRAPARDGVVLMKMIDALYESARTGKSVEIK